MIASIRIACGNWMVAAMVGVPKEMGRMTPDRDTPL